MHRRLALVRSLAVLASFASAALAQAPKFEPPAKVEPTKAELESIRGKVQALEAAIRPLEGKVHDDDWASVAVFHKAGVWILRHREFFTKNDAGMALRVLDEGLARSRELAAGKRPWRAEKGASARGYRSKVDGSIQPYFVVVPDGFDRDAASRLDVVLHGRGGNLHEVRFLHDRARTAASAKAPGLVLHVFGRTNNAYRWAGEADVFEAIDAVKREFRVDDDRVLLRGFSMGGAGAWHLGLRYPAVWAAVDAGAGFSETVKYAKQKDLPAWREKLLHIYDARDYALNAFNVPIAGYGGELDPQLQASENILEALKTLGFAFDVDGLLTVGKGIDFRRIVGKGMGHKVDPASEELLRAFRDERAAKGRNTLPTRVRFVTYTPRTGRAAWFAVEGMPRIHERATVEASIDESRAKLSTENVNLIAVDRAAAETVEIDGAAFPLREAVKGLLPRVYFRKGEMGWSMLDYEQSRAWEENVDRRKRPGLQGPIDDAFLGPILVVEPTGTPWNPRTAEWTKQRMNDFRETWSKYLRGDVPVKRDVDVTAEDIAARHLVVFGDPGSNALLARAAKELPVAWNKSRFRLDADYDASTHVPVFITVNPLEPRRYLVVNSGLTLRPSDFIGTNALLFPRLGDWAVFSASGGDEPAASGFFDNAWKLAR
ncbi:MAG: PHB depolymerase family esterase [Isosphaeraceae bacterium]|nr:PHB depolymerase family esterase [Isosphaeraceae bacterium]